MFGGQDPQIFVAETAGLAQLLLACLQVLGDGFRPGGARAHSFKLLQVTDGHMGNHIPIPGGVDHDNWHPDART